MDNYAPIITAVGGLLVGVLGAVLGYKRYMKTRLPKLADDHLQTFYKTMNAAMAAQEARHLEAIAQTRTEQREERKQWADERKIFNEKIDTLQHKIEDHIKALHSKEIEVVRLSGQIDLLTDRLGHMGSDVPVKPGFQATTVVSSN